MHWIPTDLSRTARSVRQARSNMPRSRSPRPRRVMRQAPWPIPPARAQPVEDVTPNNNEEPLRVRCLNLLCNSLEFNVSLWENGTVEVRCIACGHEANFRLREY